MRKILTILAMYYATPALAQKRVNLHPLQPVSMQEVDTTENKREYSNELGYFQKAHRDLNDPRFMFHDEDRNFDLGIGGTAKIASFYGFCGGYDGNNFTPSLVPVPTNPSNVFGTNINGCEVHFKSRAYWHDHKMVTYLKLGSNNDYSVSVKQVYISVNGFSFGLIPTFFTDLEAGVKTHLCSGALDDPTHPLLGYTYRSKNGWEIAAAAEKATFDANDYKIPFIEYDYQPLPDFTAHFKYRGNWGHVQLGVVARDLTYWQKDESTIYMADGKDGHIFGFGISLSGNLKPSKKMLFSWNVLGGKGVGHYLGYVSDVNLDVGLSDKMLDTYKTLNAIPILSESVSAQYNFTDKILASFSCGFAQCFQNEHTTKIDNVKNLATVTTGLFFDLSDFAFCGIEYYYGRRSQYQTLPTDPTAGNAHRIAILLAYMF